MTGAPLYYTLTKCNNSDYPVLKCDRRKVANTVTVVPYVTNAVVSGIPIPSGNDAPSNPDTLDPRITDYRADVFEFMRRKE